MTSWLGHIVLAPAGGGYDISQLRLWHGTLVCTDVLQRFIPVCLSFLCVDENILAFDMHVSFVCGWLKFVEFLVDGSSQLGHICISCTVVPCRRARFIVFIVWIGCTVIIHLSSVSSSSPCLLNSVMNSSGLSVVITQHWTVLDWPKAWNICLLYTSPSPRD